LLEEAMRLSSWPPLVPTDGPQKRNRYETKRAEFVEELDKMELEGIPAKFAHQAARMGEKTMVPATETQPAFCKVQSVKLRALFFTQKFSKPFDLKDGNGRTTQCHTFPLFAALVTPVISMHVTSAAAERNWSIWGQVYADARRSSLLVKNAELLVMIMAHYRKKRRDAMDAIDEVVCMDFLEVEDEE
jgi:hypothetical protein